MRVYSNNYYLRMFLQNKNLQETSSNLCILEQNPQVFLRNLCAWKSAGKSRGCSTKITTSLKILFRKLIELNQVKKKERTDMTSNKSIKLYSAQSIYNENIFFCGGWGSNPELCLYYALSLPTELNSRELMKVFKTLEWICFEGKNIPSINHGTM